MKSWIALALTAVVVCSADEDNAEHERKYKTCVSKVSSVFASSLVREYHGAIRSFPSMYPHLRGTLISDNYIIDLVNDFVTVMGPVSLDLQKCARRDRLTCIDQNIAFLSKEAKQNSEYRSSTFPEVYLTDSYGVASQLKAAFAHVSRGVIDSKLKEYTALVKQCHHMKNDSIDQL